MQNKQKWPTVSIIISTFNCKSLAERCVKSILEQDYPPRNIEILAVDSYSTDGTIEALEKLGVRVILTRAKYPEGRGKAKWLGYQEAKNEIIIYTDSDTKLLQPTWLKSIITPLIEDETISLSVPRMSVVKQDKPVNRYLSLVGTDPFMLNRSLDPLYTLGKLRLTDKGEYYTYEIKLERFINVGSYSLAAKKSTLDKIGGYTHDVEVSYQLVKNGMGKIAISKKATIHHLMSDGIIRFAKKKYWWANVYFETQRYNREFLWVPHTFSSKIRLGLTLVKNLSLIPAALLGIRMAMRDRESAWLLHPIMVWLTSASYLTSYIKNDIFKKYRKSDMRTHQIVLKNDA